MKLPNQMTSQQIRVLQEFRRKAQDTLTSEEVNAIAHPGGGGGEAPAAALVGSGYLSSSEGSYNLTDRGKEFLARPAVPLFSGGDAQGTE